MIQEKQLSWLSEFLKALCEKPEDRYEVNEIVDTFKKLWHVAQAAQKNPYPRSPRLTEALAAIKGPAEGPEL